MKRAKKLNPIDRFNAWVKQNGGEVLAKTNPYEVHRFKTIEGTFVIYNGTKGKQTFSSPRASEIYQAFENGELIKFSNPLPRQKKTSIVTRTLIERDGNNCFYCACEFSEIAKSTIEHLVSVVHEGPNHISNKFLACEDCNLEAGHMSAPEKIRLRDQKRNNRNVQRSFVPDAVLGSAA